MEILVGGSVISTLAHGASAGAVSSWTKNDDFAAGLLQFRNQAGGNTTTDVQAVCTMKRRA
jgi:hypothetical protein